MDKKNFAFDRTNFILLAVGGDGCRNHWIYLDGGWFYNRQFV